MSLRFPKRLLRLSAICFLLAVPIVAAVVVRVQGADRAVATIGTEQTGLRCALMAGDVLAAIERYRLTALGPPAARGRVHAARDALGTAFRSLEAPDCAAFIAGPRVNLRKLQATEATLAARSDAGLEMSVTRPLADAVLALFLDIADTSGLDYDASVDTVNLQDALMARIPVGTERLEQSAQLLALAGRRRALALADVVEVEKLSGQASANNVMANDDFDGALFALPDLGRILTPARTEADRAVADLAKALDRGVAGGDLGGARDLSALRRASIAAGQRLLHTSARVLETAFDARVASLRERQRLCVGAGGIIIVVVCGIAALLWQALRRRDRAELERARERENVLETELARRSAERALRMTEQQFRAVFDGSDVGIAIVDRDGKRIDANTALFSMFDGDLDLISKKAGEMFAEVVGDRRDSYRAEHRFTKSDGEPLWAELSLSAVRGGLDDAVSAVVLVHDITEHKTLNARLDHETLHDALTGLPNRVQFIRRLATMIGKAERFAVVFIDLDGFKAVNDALGHHAGDDVLRLAAQRLSAAVRPLDLVAGLHGDEFAVLVRDMTVDSNRSDIEDIVGRLRDALALSVEAPAGPIHVSASIGYVPDGASYRDAERLLRDADSAMYRSKVGGRNRATAYVPAPNTTQPVGL